MTPVQWDVKELKESKKTEPSTKPLGTATNMPPRATKDSHFAPKMQGLKWTGHLVLLIKKHKNKRDHGHPTIPYCLWCDLNANRVLTHHSLTPAWQIGF